MREGCKVIDDLTGDICVVKELIKGGVIISSKLFEGYRFDWEVTEI